ncbi:hypothetical protein M514_10318 [Trichuris suis]|uniref:Uncharacterized protein n=1 Tax=Trichuris suis TaxID=68888 RepID=A0A085NIR1_9BILA|nr:hypothetical protein M513_10318 [Trichuris suis]KFD69357.1 hypothetical protein M514_10318 [Trichuris suis]
MKHYQSFGLFLFVLFVVACSYPTDEDADDDDEAHRIQKRFWGGFYPFGYRRPLGYGYGYRRPYGYYHHHHHHHPHYHRGFWG